MDLIDAEDDVDKDLLGVKNEFYNDHLRQGEYDDAFDGDQLGFPLLFF